MTGSKQIDIPPAIADRLFVGASHARGRGDYLKQADREVAGERGRGEERKGMR